MATEKGVVTKLESNAAWVTTTRTEACESCAAKGSCRTLGGGKEMEVEAINLAGARVGLRSIPCCIVARTGEGVLGYPEDSPLWR